MKLIINLIIFSIFVVNVAFSDEKPPFKNILVLDKPKSLNEIQDLKMNLFLLIKSGIHITKEANLENGMVIVNL